MDMCGKKSLATRGNPVGWQKRPCRACNKPGSLPTMKHGNDAKCRWRGRSRWLAPWFIWSGSACPAWWPAGGTPIRCGKWPRLSVPAKACCCPQRLQRQRHLPWEGRTSWMGMPSDRRQGSTGGSDGQSGLHERFRCIAIRFVNDNDSQLQVK